MRLYGTVNLWCEICSTDHAALNSNVVVLLRIIRLLLCRHFRDLQTCLFTQTKWMSVESLSFRMWGAGFQLSLHWKHFEPVVAVLGFASFIVFFLFSSLLESFHSNNFWYYKCILLGFCLRNHCTVAIIAFFIPVIHFLIYNWCT